MGGQSEGGKYDIHTVLLDCDEQALQKAHEIVGGLIYDFKGVVQIDELEEVRSLIGNVLASAELT